jgi:hypothetical protein
MKILTSIQITKIGETVNLQFQNLVEGDPPAQVVLFGESDFKIQKTSDSHILIMDNFSKLKDIEGPQWLKITSSVNTNISAPHSKTAELVYLLWKSYEDSIKDPSQPYHNSVSSQLKTLSKVWKGEGEPLGIEVQRGLLGEIFSLVEIAKVKKNEAIESWDEKCTNPVDFTHADWGVEAKAKTPASSSVEISSQEQLTHKGNPLILSVVDISKDKEGKSLPQLIQSQLVVLKGMGIDKVQVQELHKMIDDNYLVFAYESSFSSKWKIGDIVFYDIPATSVPSVFSSGIPVSIKIPQGYTLILSGLVQNSLSALLPN